MPFPRDADGVPAGPVGGKPVPVREDGPSGEPVVPGQRAAIFIDGNNWYHGLRRIEVSTKLDYRAVATKLIRNREWVGTRYYVGRVSGDLRRMRNQEQFLRILRDQGVSVYLGRVQRNPMSTPFERERNRLVRILSEYEDEVPRPVREAIRQLSNLDSPQYVEKEVDTRISVDLVRMAFRDEYDAAYLLSADSDFIPAVEAVRELGKTVFAASAAKAKQLAAAVDTYIPLPRRWFEGLRPE